MTKIHTGKAPFKRAWRNFVQQLNNNRWENRIELDKGLAAFNAKNIYGTAFVEFASKEDVTAFVLRFS